MLSKVKQALRITHNYLDEEIQDLIDACKQDLNVGGVNVISDDDPLILQAVKIYCKAYMHPENMERYILSYRSMKTSLALCGDYNA